ncbi:hypothetical protein ACFC0S_19675 [Streptomyces sp. NPDC056084]|uniref:hypothetical protein n=1 Tax=unclassified Streptomyces TaxID=2593676 RepID=UPI0035DD2C2D
MNLVRKLAAGAIAVGLTSAGVLAASPANAQVVNSSCNLSNVVRVNYTGGAYCYVWDGNKASGYVGAMNIHNAQSVCSGSYVGYVQDAAGKPHDFGRNGCTPALGGLTLTSITFTGN